MIKELTKAEERVMQILWEIKAGFVKDILEKFPYPKPACTTVSTIIRILEKKGFVTHKAFGKTHQYYPLIEKHIYTRIYMKGVLKKYFNNSLRQMVSYFSQEKSLTVSELEELRRIIDDEIRKQKEQ